MPGWRSIEDELKQAEFEKRKAELVPDAKVREFIETWIAKSYNKGFQEGVGRGVAAGFVLAIGVLLFLQWLFAAS